jgi:hypothetical protein
MPPNRTGAAAELFAGTLPVHAARDRFHAIAATRGRHPEEESAAPFASSRQGPSLYDSIGSQIGSQARGAHPCSLL